MLQKHSIILWRQAEEREKSFEEIVKESYKTFELLKNLPREVRPNYLVGISGKSPVEFSWTYEDFRKAILERSNKEGGKIFEVLGYYLSFFSSFDEKESWGFDMRMGIKNVKFVNSLIIRFSINFDVFKINNSEWISEVFVKLVQCYKPFWGCVSNSVLYEKYGRFMEKDLPRTVHWLNYWSDSICSAIGTEKIQRIVRENEEASFTGGIFKMKNTAINAEAEDEMEYQMQLHNQLFS